MEIDRILYPIESLGPGKRIVIWSIGCSKKCLNCANQELWDKNPKKNMSVIKIYQFIKQIFQTYPVDGITFTGGDPLEQEEELCELLELCKTLTSDIIVYTGYTLAEIKPEILSLLRDTIGLLIDGRYIENLNDNKCPLRGSINQEFHYFNKELIDKYEQYLCEGRKVQNIFYQNKLISVGISDKGK